MRENSLEEKGFGPSLEGGGRLGSGPRWAALVSDELPITEKVQVMDGRALGRDAIEEIPSQANGSSKFLSTELL